MKKIMISFLFFFILLLLSISIILANDVYNKEIINKEKIYYEIKYLDTEILSMIKKLANTNNQVNWKELLNYTNNLYNYWNSAILDFNYLNIEKKHLINFGKDLDNLTVSIKYSDKKNTLQNLIELYNKITLFAEELNYDNYENILLTKYNLLLAYSFVQNGNWTLTHEYILKASDNIYKVVNTLKISKYTQYNINQAYVAVREMENIINIKDIDVFYIKYKIALDKLENL